MSPAAATTTNTASPSPFETIRSSLVSRLASLQVPKGFSLQMPRRGEFDEVAAFIRDLANVCDEALYAIGSEVADNAARGIDMSVFSGAFLGAVEGNADFVTRSACFSCDSDEEAA